MARIIKILVIVLLLAGGTVGVYAWLQVRGGEEDPFTTVAVERGGIVEKAVAVGQIEPRLQFRVKSKISGIVKTASVQVGDRVRAGDALIEILPDPTPSELVEAERMLETGQSALRRAEADWNRVQQLAEQGIISEDEVDAKREAFETASIEVERSRDNLMLVREGRIAGRGSKMESVIRAPAAGIVLQRIVNPGDSVVPLTSFQEGTELLTIADMTDLIFRGTVDEIDVGKLQVGLPARLKIGALPDAHVTGKLTHIAPQAIEEDGAKLFKIEIELDAQDDAFLRAGYSANADLIIQERTDILLIPERLLLFEGEGEQAQQFVETPPNAPGGEPQKVEIETGLSDGLNIEVTSGVKEGELIVQRPPRDVLG